MEQQKRKEKRGSEGNKNRPKEVVLFLIADIFAVRYAKHIVDTDIVKRRQLNQDGGWNVVLAGFIF